MDRTIEARMAANIPRTVYNEISEEESPNPKRHEETAIKYGTGYQRQFETNSSGFQLGHQVIKNSNVGSVGQVKVKQYMPPGNRNRINATEK